jgi:phosphoglycolate phosphatase
MTLAAAFFDLDGTLVDSLEDLTDAVNFMLERFGKNTLSSMEVCNMVGKGAKNLIQRALGSKSREDIERGLKLFLEYNSSHIADKSRLYPGTRTVLDTLSNNKLRMAVISNKNEELSRLVLKSLSIDRYFETVCGGDTFPEMKPSPLPLQIIANSIGAAPRETVMIGDSINDIQAGREAGAITIGCTWGYGNLPELGDADYLADSCDNLLEILMMLKRSKAK